MTMDDKLRVEEAKVTCARKVFDVIKEHAAVVYPEPTAAKAYDAHEEERQAFLEAVLEMLSE